MDITIALAASRLVAQQRAMDVTANNIANVNTPGFRTERVQFSDWIDNQSGSASAPGVKSIAYTQDRATWRESQPGSITHTGNPFDLALTGDGYFTVNTRRSSADPRWPLRSDAGRHAGRQQRQCGAGYHRQADPDPANRYPDHHRRRRLGVDRERAARQDRRGAANRSDEAAGRRCDQFRFGRAHHAGAVAGDRAGRDGGVQCPAGAGGDPDDGQRASVPVRHPTRSGRGRPQQTTIDKLLPTGSGG